MEVLSPRQRVARPYPRTTRLVQVTTLCQNHSKWNPNRKPEETEALLEPVLQRLAAASQVEIVFFENVPEYLSVLDGQERSSYTAWVAALEEQCGFSQARNLRPIAPHSLPPAT